MLKENLMSILTALGEVQLIQNILHGRLLISARVK